MSSRRGNTTVHRRFLQLLRNEIVQHFKVEENGIFPLLKEEAIVLELLQEHDDVLRTFTRLQRDKIVTLKDLLEKLSGHVKRENELLSLVKRKLE